MSLQLIQDCIGRLHYSTLSKTESKLESESNPINRLIHKYQKQNKDFRIIIGGDNGNGKSALSARIGEEQNPKTFINNPEWAVEHQIHFFAKDWLRCLQLLKPYDVNGMDEPVQSGGNHREFMTETNMVLTKTVATARFKKLIIPVCIPFIDQLDLDLQKLCQIYAYCYEQGHAEVYRISNPKFGGDPYFEKIIDELTWRMPNPALWKLYSQKKEQSENEQYQKYQDRLHKRDRENRTDDDYYKELLVNINKIIPPDKTEPRVTRIRSVLGVGRARAESLKARYEIEQEEKQESQN